MLVETERYLAKLRSSAEADAAEIIGSAEQEACSLVRRVGPSAMVRMERFLEGFCADVDDEISTVLDVARERARLQVVEATEEAGRIRAGVCSPTEPSVEDELGPEAVPPHGQGPGRVRLSAVLQVIAVLIILAFIVFRPT